MISTVFIILAAFCNSVMDNISHHWYKSVFNKFNPNFWNPLVSCITAYVVPYTKYKIDAWHLLKSLMIVFICLSVVLYVPVVNPLVDFILLGLWWNTIFNIFYNHFLNK